MYVYSVHGINCMFGLYWSSWTWNEKYVYIFIVILWEGRIPPTWWHLGNGRVLSRARPFVYTHFRCVGPLLCASFHHLYGSYSCPPRCHAQLPFTYVSPSIHLCTPPLSFTYHLLIRAHPPFTRSCLSLSHLYPHPYPPPPPSPAVHTLPSSMRNHLPNRALLPLIHARFLLFFHASILSPHGCPPCTFVHPTLQCVPSSNPCTPSFYMYAPPKLTSIFGNPPYLCLCHVNSLL
jgi:hypothetical protein